MVRVENLKTYGGRKVCENCYDELSALDWINNILRDTYENEKKEKQNGNKS
jgi:hypothetical protein